MADVMGVISGLKAAYAIASAAKDVSDQTKLNTAISEILEQLTSAQFGLIEMQQQYQQLLDENRQLREQIQKEQRFERYRLERTHFGAHVLQLKEEFSGPDNPQHAICPVCREDGRLSLMTQGEYYYSCSATSCRFAAQHTEEVWTPLNR